MRLFYSAVVILFAAVALIFALQNLGTVTVSFLSFSVSIRLAFLIVVIYVLGALTGGSLFALLRRSYEGSHRVLRFGPGSTADKSLHQ